MSSQPPTGAADDAPLALEDLPYEELHRRAFDLAQHRRDVSFFYDLYAHTRAMHAAAAEGGSLGDFSGSLMEIVEATREAFSDDIDPELQELFRARFITYLREHDEQ